jgi:hypothetical protein
MKVMLTHTAKETDMDAALCGVFATDVVREYPVKLGMI